MNLSSHTAATVFLAAGHGVEIGRFRLKPGVSEAELRAAHAAMIQQYSSRQAGWLQQYLVKLEGGVYLDVAFATSRESAEVICGNWQGQAVCDAFLALIEPESMQFGKLL